jgi:hypothetical protein
VILLEDRQRHLHAGAGSIDVVQVDFVLLLQRVRNDGGLGRPDYRVVAVFLQRLLLVKIQVAAAALVVWPGRWVTEILLDYDDETTGDVFLYDGVDAGKLDGMC